MRQRERKKTTAQNSQSPHASSKNDIKQAVAVQVTNDAREAERENEINSINSKSHTTHVVSCTINHGEAHTFPIK